MYLFVKKKKKKKLFLYLKWITFLWPLSQLTNKWDLKATTVLHFQMFLTPNHCLPQLSRILIRYVSTQQQNLSTKLVLFHDPSAQLSHMELSQKFYEAMKACASIESRGVARIFYMGEPIFDDDDYHRCMDNLYI